MKIKRYILIRIIEIRYKNGEHLAAFDRREAYCQTAIQNWVKN